MRVQDVLKVTGNTKKDFTFLARVLDSIKNGSVMDDGSCLMFDFNEEEKKLVINFIFSKLEPKIRSMSKSISRRYEYPRDKEENFYQNLCITVFEEFPKYNKPEYMKAKDKSFEISTFIEQQSKAAYRNFLVEEMGLPVNVVQNMSIVNNAVLELAKEYEVPMNKVPRELVYAKLEHKMLSHRMIDTLIGMQRGNVSLDALDDADKKYLDENAFVETRIKSEINPDTKAALDSVFARFSDLELFILLKEMGFFGKSMMSITAKEISYKEWFVDLAKRDKNGLKNVVHGRVEVHRPGRNSGLVDVIIVEEAEYVKERFYNNKVAKIRKKLLTLSQMINTDEIDDLECCIKEYCLNLWNEREISTEVFNM